MLPLRNVLSCIEFAEAQESCFKIMKSICYPSVHTFSKRPSKYYAMTKDASPL